MSTFVTTKIEGILSKPLIYVLAIIFITFLIYSNTFNAPFQFDDFINIVDNTAIKDFHYFSDPSLVKGTNIDRSLKPLFKTRYIGYLTFALNYRLHGLDVTGYHLVNIFIHMFNSLLLYWFITLTFRTPFFSVAGGHLPDSSRHFIAVFTALFFAVHPIQTQAVTYIVQRFTSLATLFYLIALVMYIKFRLQPSAISGQQRPHTILYTLYVISLISAVLAMKTKEFAFTLPLMMGMYELMFFNGKIMKRLLYLAPFLLTILLIPLSLEGTGGALADISRINEEAVNISGASVSISRGDYLITQFRVIVTYIRLLFFPMYQNLDYDYPIYSSFFTPEVVISFMFLLSIFVAGIYLYRASERSERKDRFWPRLISFGIFWFFMALFPESGVIPIRDVIYEHRVYLPSIGFFIALTGAIWTGMERLGSRAAYSKKAVVYVMITVMLVLSVAAYARNTIWQDSIKLWRNAAEGSPNKERPHRNLAVAYRAKGRTDEMINEYQTALKIKPDNVESHNNLGIAYGAQGRNDEAINEYQAALRLKPDFVDAHYNLGMSYLVQGRSDEAIKEFKFALELKSDFAQARQMLDFLLKK